jgi:hypothetical protein
VIPRISLRQALADPALLGGVLEGESCPVAPCSPR